MRQALFPHHNSRMRVEEIMTPRSLFKIVEEDELQLALQIAAEHGFDVVPIIRKGEITHYWNQADGRVLRITKRHRVPHDISVEQVLPRLNAHLIQFVYYRSEVVGLVNLSDLNKPFGRLTWLQSILEVEQAVLTRALELRVPETEIIKALGGAAKEALRWRARAKKEDIDTSLLTYVGFADVLKAAQALGILKITSSDTERLRHIRNRLAHGVQNLVEHRSDGEELEWALHCCRRIMASYKG